MIEKRLKQTTQDHRIGDIYHVEFVKAEQPAFIRDFGSDPNQRIILLVFLAERGQALLDFQHEGVEMDPALARDWRGVEEHIRQHGFAAPDRTEHVDALRWCLCAAA